MKAEVKDTGHVHLDKLVHGYLGGMISGFEKNRRIFDRQKALISGAEAQTFDDRLCG